MNDVTYQVQLCKGRMYFFVYEDKYFEFVTSERKTDPIDLLFLSRLHQVIKQIYEQILNIDDVRKFEVNEIVIEDKLALIVNNGKFGFQGIKGNLEFFDVKYLSEVLEEINIFLQPKDNNELESGMNISEKEENIQKKNGIEFHEYLTLFMQNFLSIVELSKFSMPFSEFEKEIEVSLPLTAKKSASWWRKYIPVSWQVEINKHTKAITFFKESLFAKGYRAFFSEGEVERRVINLTSKAHLRKKYLGYTDRRVFWFKRPRISEIHYRDIPLENLNGLELHWRKFSLKLLVIGLILFFVSLTLFIFSAFQILFFSMYHVLLFILGIVLLILAFLAKGFVKVIGTNTNWTLFIRGSDTYRKLQKIIQEIYYEKLLLKNTGLEY